VYRHIFVISLFLIINGCATTGTLKDIRFHTGNIEVSVNEDNTAIEWESSPDYQGTIPSTWDSECSSTQYFLFPSSLNSKPPEILQNKVNLSREASPRKEEVIKYTSLLNTCDFFIAEKWTCRGNCFREAPMVIVVLNNQGEVVSSTVLPEREEIPIKYWPELAAAGLVDGLLGILMLPIAIIAAPLSLLDNTEEKSNNSIQPTDKSAAD